MVKLLQVSSAASIIKEVDYIPSWSEVTDKPTTFSPSTHVHVYLEAWQTPDLASQFLRTSGLSTPGLLLRKNNASNSIDFIGNISNQVPTAANNFYLVLILSTDHRPSGNRSFPILINNFDLGIARINQAGELYVSPKAAYAAGVAWSLEFSMRL